MIRLRNSVIVFVSLAAACTGSSPSSDVEDAATCDCRDVSVDVARMDGPTTTDVHPIDVTSNDVVRDVSIDAVSSCVLTTDDSYDFEGGLSSFMDVTTLTPTNGWHRTRNSAGSDATLSCALAIPACGAGAGVDLGAVVAALNDPDVLSALATSGMPLFGLDLRPVDGQVWAFRSGSHGFYVGAPCGDPPEDGCTPIPSGIASLEAVLYALDQQQLMDASCAALR